MFKLDLKDRRLIYELAQNARQSNNQIARKIGLSKETVQYRIKRLIDNNIIISFTTLIDSFKLGYESFRIYIKYQSITPKIKKEIIDWLMANNDLWFLADVRGSWDLDIFFWSKNNREFFLAYQNFLEKFRPYIYSADISIFNKIYVFCYAYINEKISDPVLIDGSYQVEHDEKDLHILSLLSENSKIPLIELSKKTNLDFKTVEKRIKRLEQEKVILRHSCLINFSKLGYNHFKADIKLRDYTKKKEIINYAKTIPQIQYMMEMVSQYDIELELHVKSYSEFVAIMEDLESRYSDAILNYDFYNLSKEYFLRFFPKDFSFLPS